MKSLKRTTCAKKIAVGFNFIISHSEKWKVKFMKSILSIAAWRRFRFLILLPLCHGNYENLFIEVFAIHLLFSRCSKLLQQRMFYAFWQVLRSNGWISSRHAFYGLIATMQMRGRQIVAGAKGKRKLIAENPPHHRALNSWAASEWIVCVCYLTAINHVQNLILWC